MSVQEPIEGEVLVEGDDKFEILGKIARAVAGYGAGVIVGQVIAANVAPKHIIQKVGVVVGGAAMAGLVAYHTGNYAKQYTDELVDTCRNVYGKVTELQEEIRKIKEANG